MKTIKLVLITSLFCILFSGIASGQSTHYYTAVGSYYNASITKAVKIKTKIPWTPEAQIPSLKIEGNDYRTPGTKMILNLVITWYAHGDGKLYNPTVSSLGSSTPDVYLANEDGNVVIYLDEKLNNQRFSLSIAFPATKDLSQFLKDWTITDEAVSTNAYKAIYGNNFKGKVGINTETPQSELDVKGTIQTDALKVTSGDLSVNGNVFLKPSMRITAHETDNFTYQGKPISHYGLKWEYDSWYTHGYSLWMSSYGGIKFFTEGKSRMSIARNGNVGIGTENPAYKLDVLGTISATEVKIESKWADFVFAKDYKLPSLDEVKAHIDEYQHLPGIPSEAEVKENGIGVSEITTKMMQKIEELTLYAIQQQEKDQQNKELIEKLSKRIEELEKSNK